MTAAIVEVGAGVGVRQPAGSKRNSSLIDELAGPSPYVIFQLHLCLLI